VGAHRRAAGGRARRGRVLIALLHRGTEPGAVERYLDQLASALGDEAVVVREESLPRLVQALRSLRPRIAHVIDVWPQAFVAARLARVPRVLVTHHTPALPRRDNRVGRLWQRVGWATGPEVIYTSEADRAADGRAPNHVIPLGIDLERFAGAKPALEGGRPIVGSVGRLAEQKGYDTLLEAATLVPEAEFVIVGDGELQSRLERAAGENVRLTGRRDDVPELLASFAVYAQPSRFEGLCVAVLEAQAAGVPVIATPVGGMRDTVVHEETGLVVPIGDAAALAAAVKRLLADRSLAKTLAHAAAGRVQDGYTERRMIDMTLALYA
jgi:glycosyltransferase involved in cell wall biosynthesis